MSPTQIATEAAEAIAKMVAVESEISAGCAAQYAFDNDKAAALILSAAAKMVRESGALDALLSCSPMAEYTSEEWSRLSDAKFAALEKLRSISEGEARK